MWAVPWLKNTLQVSTTELHAGRANTYSKTCQAKAAFVGKRSIRPQDAESVFVQAIAHDWIILSS